MRWFEILIWHDHRVCSECFARLTRPDPEPGESAMEPRTETATLGVDLIEPPASIANVAPMPEARTTCNECGSVRGLSQSETLSTSEATDRVPALAARLQEAGYHVKTDVIYRVVDHLKGLDRHTADDKRIFAIAAAKGVQR
ncbi:hypothetical protein NDI56_04050 [Haloarcula sp. S1CR25-12]|uniref:Uncharacterized protein n=1 Tax=Haloarcula saliterrae TaxID=2950534 RepID=A0ABU2F8H5_9EURY|nr:hypothetical protein [Haloarcula sp. S1CR25-12]MDS0258583.1 hypothetical protein [Haloarcula sp. S1CR25-12]